MKTITYMRDGKPTTVTPVQRWVITHLNKDGMRTLVGPAQGQHTYGTREQAQHHLDAILQNNSPETLESVYGFPLEVRECDCWPNHYDPMGIYFD